MYDSSADTQVHIAFTEKLMQDIINRIRALQKTHDASKLQAPEKELFDRFMPDEIVFGSEAYMERLREMEDVLYLHYQTNRHHPEHFENGINGMTLMDLIEMIADWRTSSIRGSMSKSMEINRARFGIGEQLFQVLVNTAREMEWIPRNKG